MFKLWNEELARVKLDEWGIDFIVSNGFGPIIKEPILTNFKEKIVNIHPAYLPHGRGIYPNFWSFFEGYPKGVTIHYIDAGIDTGNILLRKVVVFESGGDSSVD